MYQPCDGVINKSFKNLMTNEWESFLNEPTGEVDFTKSVNRKKPSYERILLIVSNSVKEKTWNDWQGV